MPERCRISCGEKWPGGILRPAIEDLLGAGAILTQFDPRDLSPEAKVAAGAYEAATGDIQAILKDCASGRELTDAGYPEDVAMASEVNVSGTVPKLVHGAYRAVY